MIRLFALALVLYSLFGNTALMSVEVLTKGRVSRDRVNLRALPKNNSEVVGQIGEGTVVNVKSIKSMGSTNWLEIVSPEFVDFWAYRDFVETNTVKATKLQVRVGPGINFSVVGQLKRGDSINVRGNFGEWVKIAPPESCSLWVNAAYVTLKSPLVLDQGEAAGTNNLNNESKPSVSPCTNQATEPKSVDVCSLIKENGRQEVFSTTNEIVIEQQRITVVANETITPLKAVVSIPKPVLSAANLPADWKLLSIAGQGRVVEREGYLKKMGFFFGRPTPFKLFIYGETICYVKGDESQLEGYIDRLIVVRGREYRIKDSHYPIVIVEQIIPR